MKFYLAMTLSIFLIGCSTSPDISQGIEQSQDHLHLKEAKQKARAHLANFTNIEANYRRIQTRQPHPEFVKQVSNSTALHKEGELRVFVESDTRQFQHHFRCLKDMIWHEQRLSTEQAETLKSNNKVEYFHWVQVVTNDRAESMNSQLHRPNTYNGSINPLDKSPIPQTNFDVLLGIRVPEQGAPAAIRLLKEACYEFAAPDEDGNRILTATYREKERHHVWHFDPSHDYTLSKYQKMNPKSGNINRRITVKKYDFNQGVPMPVEILDERISYAYGQEAVIVKNQMFVTSYRLNPPGNLPSSYAIKWPIGTRITDLKDGLVYKIVQRLPMP